MRSARAIAIADDDRGVQIPWLLYVRGLSGAVWGAIQSRRVRSRRYKNSYVQRK